MLVLLIPLCILWFLVFILLLLEIFPLPCLIFQVCKWLILLAIECMKMFLFHFCFEDIYLGHITLHCFDFWFPSISSRFCSGNCCLALYHISLVLFFIFVPMYVLFAFPVTTYLYLFIRGFKQSNYDVAFIYFCQAIVFEIHLPSEICGFCFHWIWTIFKLYFSYYFCLSSLSCSFWDSNYIYSKLIKFVPQLSDGQFFKILFALCFLFILNSFYGKFFKFVDLQLFVILKSPIYH